MTDAVSDVVRIEAEISATKARIGAHLDELKGHLHPVEIAHDVAAVGLAAARQLPARLSSRTVLGILATLGGLALLLTLRGSRRTPRPALPQTS